MKTVVVFLKNDFRLNYNLAITSAINNSGNYPVIVVAVLDKKIGEASLWWEAKALESFSQELDSINIPLLVCDYKIEIFLEQLKKTFEIIKIYNVSDHNLVEQTNYLFLPESMDKNFKRFTPYLNYIYKTHTPILIEEQPKLKKQKKFPTNLLNNFEIIKKKYNSVFLDNLEKNWVVSEKEANKKWIFFKNNILENYYSMRDFPSKNSISFLSPYLKFGQISIHSIWQDIVKDNSLPAQDNNINKFLSELVWREFSNQLLFNNHQMRTKPLNEKYKDFKWIRNDDHLNLWKNGMTGYPIIDAGMRQLNTMGWMHNRVRMLTASFLTKNLLISWQEGESFFFDRLVDADAANNSNNWQWVAGTGTDSSPYFRIFNPVIQSKKFDPTGEYIRQWIPELSSLNNKDIHMPTPSLANINNYPKPIVKLNESRIRALKAFSNFQHRKKEL
jgi:deoxyribodipyrimidine photo-lyase